LQSSKKTIYFKAKALKYFLGPQAGVLVYILKCFLGPEAGASGYKKEVTIKGNLRT
jgi:hypothetical protein